MEEQKRMANDYNSIATMIIAKHILECAKDLEDTEY